MMGAISKVLRNVAGGGLTFWCPGCDEAHTVNVGEGPGPRWGWNGSVDRPTFTPSVLVQGAAPLTDDEHAAYLRGEGLPEPRPFRCHSFVADGQIQFLGDCTHSLAGQTVPLPEKWEPDCDAGAGAPIRDAAMG
jgi:hypothetical protein